MLVLGLETSCDETGVALYDTESGLVGEALHSQVDLHAVYGGVVPEIAARDHLRRLLPLIEQVLKEAGAERPDAIAYTAGPGLVGALMVGAGMANGLALAWRCPVVPVHHMEGHLLAPMLEDDPPAYPFMALLVSGGHTMLVWVEELGSYSANDTFKKLFFGNNVQHESYFDLMTHFDFKTLLPALLHVEDRMSMAHGLEARVPFLDHNLIELAATIPSDIKFKNGELKRLLVKAFNPKMPKSIASRKDKMGFPVPFNEWIQTDLSDFIFDIFQVGKNKGRRFFNSDEILNNLLPESKFTREIWGLLSLELWMQEFHDQNSKYKQMIN